MSSIMRRRSGLISVIGGLPFQGWVQHPNPGRPNATYSATAHHSSRVSGLVQSISPVSRRCVVIAKQPAVKRYIVTLSADERERLNALIQKGTGPARQMLKARILLKADASEAGEAWSDGEIAEALDTSIDTIARTRQQLVEGGLDAALTRKHSPNSARKRIFDGVAEARLIALACSAPPKGRKRWTLTLLETAVVQLNIVDRASDNTIGRTLKKTFSVRQAKLALSNR